MKEYDLKPLTKEELASANLESINADGAVCYSSFGAIRARPYVHLLSPPVTCNCNQSQQPSVGWELMILLLIRSTPCFEI